MRKRLLKRTTLSGFGAWILSVLPFFQEGSQMNLTSWALLVIGTLLVFSGFFKPERQMTPRQAADLLESRKQYLPQLRENIIKKTKHLEYVRDMASKMTFKEYLTKYVSHPSKLNIKIHGLLFVIRED